mmetsp:Transcript_112746/g.304412  ORF Transcript_112746/g.304412 Transcript_112746/m.304412 type:complete len:442 (+) Transcript_112746:89-1414(+)
MLAGVARNARFLGEVKPEAFWEDLDLPSADAVPAPSFLSSTRDDAQAMYGASQQSLSGSNLGAQRVSDTHIDMTPCAELFDDCVPSDDEAKRRPKTDTGFFSKGSIYHNEGRCVPCKYNRSHRGCLDGANCVLCHHPHQELTYSAMRRGMKEHAINLHASACSLDKHWESAGSMGSTQCSFSPAMPAASWSPEPSSSFSCLPASSSFSFQQSLQPHSVDRQQGFQPLDRVACRALPDQFGSFHGSPQHSMDMMFEAPRVVAGTSNFGPAAPPGNHPRLDVSRGSLWNSPGPQRFAPEPPKPPGSFLVSAKAPQQGFGAAPLQHGFGAPPALLQPRAQMPPGLDLPPPPQHGFGFGVPLPPAPPPQHALISLGALHHDAGRCTPCKYNRSKRGCLDGANCVLCHHPHLELSYSGMRYVMKEHSKQRRLQAAASASASTGGTC